MRSKKKIPVISNYCPNLERIKCRRKYVESENLERQNVEKKRDFEGKKVGF